MTPEQIHLQAQLDVIVQSPALADYFEAACAALPPGSRKPPTTLPVVPLDRWQAAWEANRNAWPNRVFHVPPVETEA